MKILRKIRITISDIPYYFNIYKRRVMDKIRYGCGWLASKQINTHHAMDLVWIPRWKIKLFKCVTAGDVYLITGIWHALIKPKRCEGYSNFALSDTTYHRIGKALKKNYKWNDETYYDNRADSKIAFTWMCYSPISVDGIPENHILWYEGDVRDICQNKENGGWKFVK